MGYYYRSKPLGPKSWAAIGIGLALGTGIVIGGQNTPTHYAGPSTGSFSSAAAAQPPATVTVVKQAPKQATKPQSSSSPQYAEQVRLVEVEKPATSTAKPKTPASSQPKEGRTGATCKDGTSSSATGSGACSGHGGVATWTY